MERAILDLISHGGGVSAYFAFGLAFAAAFLKYTVPPLPGDLTVLLLSFYVAMKHQSLLPVAAGIAVGGTIGAIAAYRIGSRGANLPFMGDRIKTYFDKLEEPFRKCAFFILVFNRFLPGIRPVIFPLAGAYGVETGTVVTSAVVGNLLFGAFLYTVVSFAGNHLEQVKALYHVLGLWVEFLALTLGVMALIFVYRKKIFGLLRREG